MQGKKQNKKNKNQGNQGPWGQIRLGGFRAEFPQPRLPRLLGAARSLNDSLSVYPHIKLDFPLRQQKASIAAGNVAQNVSIDVTALLTNWTHIATVFREYAVVGLKLEIRMANVVNGAGVVAVYLDESSATAPSAAEAMRRARLDVLINQQTVPGSYMLSWTPRDLLDLDYTASGTAFVPIYLKVYTDTVNFNAGSTTTGDVIITGAVALDLRGYN